MNVIKIKIAKKVFAITLSLFLAVSLCFTSTTKAFANQTIKTYSWKTQINSSISTDGSINVSENRIIDITKFIEKAKSYKQSEVYTSKGEANLHPLVWSFNSFPEATDITLSNAKIAILSNDDAVVGNWSNINQGTYLSKWHDEDGPSNSLYAYDSEYKQINIYTELTNPDQFNAQQCYEIMAALTSSKDTTTWTFTKSIINMNYTIERAAKIYKDVADINWTYCTDTWQMDSYDVSVNVSIPSGNTKINNPLDKVENDLSINKNVYAWGHGSSTGIVDLSSDGIVHLNNGVVPAQTDAELRIVFPASWLTNLDPASDISQQNQTKLTTILKEESMWRDNRTDNVNKMLIPICFISLCIVILVLILITAIRYRKKFIEDALSYEKLNNIHPCILVRLKNWNHEFSHDIIVSLLHLNEEKRITIKRLPSNDFIIKLKNKKLAKDAYKTKTINIIDKRTIHFLFAVIACGNSQIRLSDIENYANARSYDFMSNYLAWHSLLTDEVNEFANLGSKYDKIRHITFGISIVLGILSLILGIAFFELITPIIGIICAFVIAYVGNSLRNKVYFKDAEGNHVDAIDINVGLAQYTKTTDKFRIKAIKTLKHSVLNAQDKISL